MKYNENQLQELLNNPVYQDIGALPSQFHGYDWNRLYIRPFTIPDFTLVSKASVMGDMNHMIRAIDLTITQDAANLTIGDFYYVMMWLRIHSMPKTPLIVDWTCEAGVLTHKENGSIIFNDETFQEPEDRSKYEVKRCEAQTTESITMVNLEIMSLDEEPENVVIPEGFDFPRAKHIEDIKAALKDPERSMLVPAVQWIAGETLADKFKTLKESPDGMDMFATGLALNDRYTNHGIREVTTLQCRKCRNKVPYEVSITPLSFFH